MNYLVISILFLLILLSMMYFLRELRRPAEIKKLIQKGAKERGLGSFEIRHPMMSDWDSNPFDNKFKIGKTPFDGFPINREYFRILRVAYNLANSEVWWIKATMKWKSQKLELEWRRQKNKD